MVTLWKIYNLWPFHGTSSTVTSQLAAVFRLLSPSTCLVRKQPPISVSKDKSVMLTHTMNSLEGDWSSPENKSCSQKWGCPSLQHLLLNPFGVDLNDCNYNWHYLTGWSWESSATWWVSCLGKEPRDKKHPGQTKTAICSSHLES